MNPSFNELYKRILEVCPNAYFDEDMEGQIVIYTGLHQESGDDSVPLATFNPED